MLNLKITFESEHLLDLLNRLDTAHSPEALASFMGVTIGEYLQERAKARFHNEGDDVSGPWVELSETTWVFREQAGYPPDHPINHRTGRLEYYITGTKVGSRPTTTGGAIVTFPKNPPRGATKQKVETAQFGKLRPTTPPRPVLGINERDVLFATSALQEYIMNAARGKI